MPQVATRKRRMGDSYNGSHFNNGLEKGPDTLMLQPEAGPAEAKCKE